MNFELKLKHKSSFKTENFKSQFENLKLALILNKERMEINNNFLVAFFLCISIAQAVKRRFPVLPAQGSTNSANDKELPADSSLNLNSLIDRIGHTDTKNYLIRGILDFKNFTSQSAFLSFSSFEDWRTRLAGLDAIFFFNFLATK